MGKRKEIPKDFWYIKKSITINAYEFFLIPSYFAGGSLSISWDHKPNNQPFFFCRVTSRIFHWVHLGFSNSCLFSFFMFSFSLRAVGQERSRGKESLWAYSITLHTLNPIGCLFDLLIFVRWEVAFRLPFRPLTNSSTLSFTFLMLLYSEAWELVSPLCRYEVRGHIQLH